MCIMCRCRGSGERRVEIKFVLIFVLSLDTVSLCAWPMGKGEGCEGAWSSRFCGNEPSREKNPYLTPHQNNDSLCLKIIQKSCQVSANHRLFIQFGKTIFASEKILKMYICFVISQYLQLTSIHSTILHSTILKVGIQTSQPLGTRQLEIFKTETKNPGDFRKPRDLQKKKKLKIFLKTCCHSLLMEWLLCHHLYIHSG